jgi:hypothetical protein
MHALMHPTYAQHYERNERRLGKQRGTKRRGRDSNSRTTLPPSTVFETVRNTSPARSWSGAKCPGECQGE